VLMRALRAKQIRDTLTKRANDFGLILEDVALTHLSFSKDFAKAIEQKQVAAQEAERAKFVVQKSDEERKAAVIRAQGESEAAKLISEATKATGPALLELRRIEAAKEIAQTMSRSSRIVYLPSSNSSNMLLGINAGQQGGTGQ